MIVRVVPVEMGSLCIYDGSVDCPGDIAKLRATYGRMDHEAIGLEGSGWFTEDPDEISQLAGDVGVGRYSWRTEDFEAGDCVIFGMHTLHMSSTNTTDRVRISCDTRWQPREDRVDPRYVGDVDVNARVVAGIAKAEADKVSAKSSGTVSMTDLRRQWGFAPSRPTV